MRGTGGGGSDSRCQSEYEQGDPAASDLPEIMLAQEAAIYEDVWS